MVHPYELRVFSSFWDIVSGVLNDWAPYVPLTIVSTVLLISLLFFSKFRTNALILLGVFILPIGGLYLYCRLFNISHFITSRYLICFLPLFFITQYMSLSAIEDRFGRLKKNMSLRLLFVILFIASNLVMLPLYYRAEKEDFRGLVNYFKTHTQGRR